MKKSSCAKKGFTLIELLVVISIIGILATIVIGPMNSFLDGASQDAAKQSLANVFGSADKFAKKKKKKMLWPGKDTIKAPHEFAIYQLKKWETNIDDAGIWFLPNDAQRDILEDEGNEIPDKILTTEGSLDKYKSAFGYNIAVPPAGEGDSKAWSRVPTQLCGPEDSTRVTPSGAKTVLGGMPEDMFFSAMEKSSGMSKLSPMNNPKVFSRNTATTSQPKTRTLLISEKPSPMTGRFSKPMAESFFS